MSGPRPFNRLPTLLCFVLFLGLVPAGEAAGQAPDRDRLRVGLTLGGVSFVGLSFEYRMNNRSVDLILGTSALRDVSVSVVGRQYLGPRGLQPFFGLGLWGLTAFQEEGAGAALILRAPVGVDWRVVSEHYVGATMSINRALGVRRVDPDDVTPVNRSLVPLPGFYYRWRH